jgi:Fe-S oxidoreductase
MAEEIISITAECVQGDLPPCTCACPVNFNSRAFFDKLKKGNFDGAYREYANQVLFPEVVSRICGEACRDVCPEEIEMIRLERASILHTTKRDPISYNLPVRPGTVAVIGAGLAGLACAYKLAMRRYSVTVFDRADHIGGSLEQALDRSIFEAEFALQFKYLKYSLVLNHEISDLDELKEFDVIFIATGAGGEGFGMLAGWDKTSTATSREGIFLGGRVAGGSDMNALMAGIIAGASIDKYLKVKSMTGQPETFLRTDCRIPTPLPKNGPPVVSAEGGDYTKEEAVREASRCQKCDCALCRDSCSFLQHMDLMPRKAERDAKMAATAQKGLFERAGTRMIVSCAVCGQCGAVCPKEINLETILITSKRQLFEDGYFASSLHDFYLRDMDRALTEAYVAKTAPGYGRATYAFFPGCQMTASGTEHVEKAYAYMREKCPDTALMMGCCGVPALWAGNHGLLERVLSRFRTDWERLGKPTVVTACPTCAKTFDAYLSDVDWISLYEFMGEKGVMPIGPESGGAGKGQWGIFDPCSSRDFPAMQESVRDVANALGMELTELPWSGHKTLCCGMGGHIHPSNPAIFEKMLAAAVGQSDVPYIAYCTNCRNLFVGAGKKCIHILDAVLGTRPLEKPFHIAELRKNRLALKKRLLENVWGEHSDIMEKKYTVTPTIPEDVYEKMDRLHVSEEDVYDVVEHCEQSNETVFDPETGLLTGHLQIGIITCWVQYRKESDRVNVVNIYCHRIKVS